MKKMLALLLGALLLGTSALAVSPKAPVGLGFNAEYFLVADAGQNQILSIDENGEISVFAGALNPNDIYGNAAGGYLDGDAGSAQLDAPWDVIAFAGGYIVSDSGNNCLRMIKDGKVTTFAGSRAAALTNGAGSTAAFNSPRGLATDGEKLYVADALNNCIRAVTKSGTVSTFAGAAAEGYADGSVTTARFNAPSGLCWFGGALYVADTGNHCIRMIKDDKVTTIAGQNSGVYEGSDEKAGGYADGWAENALFSSPCDVAVDENGVYVADTGNAAVRWMDKSGWVCTAFSADEAGLSQPAGVEVYNGKIYASDRFTGVLAAGGFLDVSEYFTDVPADSWFADFVDFASQNSLFNGVTASSFDPSGTMQRGMLAAVLGRAAQIPDRNLILAGSGSFSDVPRGEYYESALAWAADKGVISGVGDGSFAPEKNATRQETVTMLYRLARVMELDNTKTAELSGFADSESVADWAKPAMQWAVAEGIIGGNEKAELRPLAELTRAEAAKIFTQFAKLK